MEKANTKELAKILSPVYSVEEYAELLNDTIINFMYDWLKVLNEDANSNQNTKFAGLTSLIFTLEHITGREII